MRFALRLSDDRGEEVDAYAPASNAQRMLDFYRGKSPPRGRGVDVAMLTAFAVAIAKQRTKLGEQATQLSLM